MKLFFTFLSAVIITCSASGQRGVNQNLKGFDSNKQIHFGFLVGLNYLGTNLSVNNSIFTEDTIFSVNVKPAAGFNLGVITDLHLGPHWDLRAMFPTLVFGQRDFEYLIPDDNGDLFTEIRQVESTYLAIPLELKFKGQRYGNWRSYLIGGGFAGYDMVSKKKADAGDPIIRLEKWDYGVSVGFGFEFFLEYFKFAPQFKWDRGFKNLLVPDATPFTSVIDQVQSNTFSISLTFEG